MKKVTLVSLLLGVAVALPLAAGADTFTYSFSGTAQFVTGSPTVPVSFDLTLTATPITGTTGEYGITNIASSDFILNGVTLPSFNEAVSYSTTGTITPTGYVDSSLMFYDNLYYTAAEHLDPNGISFTDDNIDMLIYGGSSSTSPNDNALYSTTPEPASWLLALSGLLGIAGFVSFRRRRAIWSN